MAKLVNSIYKCMDNNIAPFALIMPCQKMNESAQNERRNSHELLADSSVVTFEPGKNFLLMFNWKTVAPTISGLPDFYT